MRTWHLTFSADRRHTLFPTEGLRRAAVRTLAAKAGAHLCLFCVVDDHIHVVVLCTRAEAGRLARSLLLSLRAVSGVRLDPAHVRPVDGRAHLDWLVRYTITQPVKHGIGEHPALWTGSCFLDLAGARVVQGLNLRLRDVLPRLRLRSVYAQAGLPPAPLVPFDDQAVRAAGPARIASAAGAALAADPALSDHNVPSSLARRAAVQIAIACGLPTSEIAWALGMTRQGARRLVPRPVDERVLRAVRLRLALEDAVRLPRRVAEVGAVLATLSADQA